MTAPPPPRDWSAIRWPEIEGADPERWVAVLPLAATEQHGPHLPLSTDVTIAEAYLARMRDLLPAELPATFLPLQPVGLSTEHLAFPGTLTLTGAADLNEASTAGSTTTGRDRGRFQLLDLRLAPGVVSPTLTRFVSAVKRLSMPD